MLHRAIYSKLKEAVSEEESEVYTSRLQELEVKLRFCRHHLGDKMATDTLLAMRGSEALGDKLDVSNNFSIFSSCVDILIIYLFGFLFF